MKRCVIMPLGSLGGTLGECAYGFADKAAERGVEYWLLPSLGENYISAIDPELLSYDGLVTAAEINRVKKDKSARHAVLKKAFSRFWKPDSYAEFEKANKDACADDYELFLRYEFSMQYDALVSYALSRGVTVVNALPDNTVTVFFD